MSETSQTESTISLPEEFIHSTLPELKTTMDGYLEDKPSLTLDGSQVDRVDGAALQFLWQYHHCCVLKETPCHLVSPSETICEALTDLGMQQILPVN